MREVIIPGEKISSAKDNKAGFGAIKRGDDIIATRYGLLEKAKGVAKVVPLNGGYIPYVGDHVIGVVEESREHGCFVDINSAYTGYLSFFREQSYNKGDILMLEIINVDEVNKVDLDFAKPLYDGKLIEVEPVKIPRIIGRKASMIDTISNGTGCRIFVGRNGRIYLKGKEESIRRAEQAIRLIERKAHTTGLTDKIKKFLETGEDDGIKK